MDVRDILFGTIGGLALFLYGMGLLSDALKTAAGDRLRTLLAKVTKWRIVALLIGAGVTSLIQSSSAMTVMVVGLINAGLLTLKQAISVILGANIGTTITGWLVAAVTGLEAFKISLYALPLIALGFAVHVFCRRPKLKTYGKIMLGFGLLLLGLHVMKEAFGVLSDERNSPVAQVLQAIGDRPILAVLAGAFFTMMIQSSSASIAIVIVLAANGAFGTEWHNAFRIAIPFVLGDNIGTTITAQLAALRTNISGKRAALAHTLFNVVGVVVVLPLVYGGLYAWFVEFICPVSLTALTIGVHIAIAHSAFNIVAAFVVLPFVGLLEKAVLLILPTRRADLERQPVTLERHLLNTPPLAIEQAKREIVRMARTAKEALDNAVAGLCSDDWSRLSKVSDLEDAVDDFQTEITRYLVELSQRQLEPSMANELPVLLHMVNDIERVSDHATNIVEIAQRKIEQRQSFSNAAEQEVARLRVEVSHMFDNVLLAVEMEDTAAAEKALRHEEAINEMQVNFSHGHAERVTQGTCDVLTGLVFIDFINNMEKIGDHLTNVAQGVVGGLQWSA
jgi:phosphate:Na+ symporter